MKKITKEEYVKRLSERFDNQIELTGEYIKFKEETLHRCTKCGETFEANPFDMMRRKNPCLFCGEDIYKREGRKLGTRKKSHEQVVQQLKDRWGDKVVALTEYDGNVKKMKFKCNVCGNEFWSKPNPLLFNSAFWCPACAKEHHGENRRKSDEQYLEDLKKVWGDRFTPLAHYGKNQNTPILHRCNKCGNEWKVNPHLLLGGEGCPECKKVVISELKRKPQEQYIEELKEIWGDKIILLGEYQTTDTPTLHRRNKCGLEWEANPHALLARHGCPRCNMSRGELRIEKWLNDHDIKFVHNKCVFDWLVTKKGAKMKPDFYLPEYNLVIEFNGIQHYESVEYFGGIETLTETQERDKIKKGILLEHQINTFEIPYWEFENIEDILSNLFEAA